MFVDSIVLTLAAVLRLELSTRPVSVPVVITIRVDWDIAARIFTTVSEPGKPADVRSGTGALVKSLADTRVELALVVLGTLELGMVVVVMAIIDRSFAGVVVPWS